VGSELHRTYCKTRWKTGRRDRNKKIRKGGVGEVNKQRKEGKNKYPEE
jgi:hypothetical protein